jgi:type IV pilus assembly protein PilV
MVVECGRSVSGGVRAGGNSCRFCRGFTLVENLITLLILSVGILGVSMLHLRSLQNMSDSLQTTRAGILANDIIDRMRANGSAALNSYAVVDIGGGTQANSPDCTNVLNCTPGDLALHDLREWEMTLDGATALVNGAHSSSLIEPHASISTSDNGEVEVAITWKTRLRLHGKDSARLAVKTVIE